MNTIAKAITIALAIYILGFMLVILAHVQNGTSNDALSNHYRGVISSILN